MQKKMLFSILSLFLFIACSNDKSINDKKSVYTISSEEVKQSGVNFSNEAYYAFDSSKLDLSKNISTLKSIEKHLTEGKNCKTIITGHADERGSDEYNDVLSNNRAKSVHSYLNSKKLVNDSNTKIEFKGKRNPVVKNAKTEADHSKNRRVEVEVSCE